MGYVHKDIHPGNVLWSFVRNELVPTNNQSLTFKIGDLGISRLETEIDFMNTTLAPWMHPPEFLDHAQFGVVGRQTDLYHAALLLAVLQGAEPTFTREEILDGAPRKKAEALGPPYGPALAKALRRQLADRTQTAFEFWKDLSGKP